MHPLCPPHASGGLQTLAVQGSNPVGQVSALCFQPCLLLLAVESLPEQHQCAVPADVAESMSDELAPGAPEC